MLTHQPSQQQRPLATRRRTQAPRLRQRFSSSRLRCWRPLIAVDCATKANQDEEQRARAMGTGRPKKKGPRRLPSQIVQMTLLLGATHLHFCARAPFVSDDRRRARARANRPAFMASISARWTNATKKKTRSMSAKQHIDVDHRSIVAHSLGNGGRSVVFRRKRRRKFRHIGQDALATSDGARVRRRRATERRQLRACSSGRLIESAAHMSRASSNGTID